MTSASDDIDHVGDRTTAPIDPIFDPSSADPRDAKIFTLEASLAEMRDRWVRSEADNANIRTRAKRDVDDGRRYAIEKFALDVVETAENLRRALERLPQVSDQEPDNIAGVRAGLVETERGFIALLERHGIKRLDPIGAAFDPNFHQAMAEQGVDNEAPGTILQTLSPTWTLNGRLLRAAMVIIAKAATHEHRPPS